MQLMSDAKQDKSAVPRPDVVMTNSRCVACVL